MLLVEERLFPGDELAAAMAAAVVAAAGDGTGAAGLEASAPAVAAVAAEGGGDAAGKDGKDSARNSLLLGGFGLSDTEGGWGEDGTTAGSLSHLVECMLEVQKERGGVGGLCCSRFCVEVVRGGLPA